MSIRNFELDKVVQNILLCSSHYERLIQLNAEGFCCICKKTFHPMKELNLRDMTLWNAPNENIAAIPESKRYTYYQPLHPLRKKSKRS